MTERKIKICFLPKYFMDVKDILEFLRINDLIPSERFEIDNEDPDYVIVKDNIYSLQAAEDFRRRGK